MRMQASTGAARMSRSRTRHISATQCGELGTLFWKLILLSITEFKEQYIQYIERGESIKHLLRAQPHQKQMTLQVVGGGKVRCRILHRPSWPFLAYSGCLNVVQSDFSSFFFYSKDVDTAPDSTKGDMGSFL